jgi:hypothetical protein
MDEIGWWSKTNKQPHTPPHPCFGGVVLPVVFRRKRCVPRVTDHSRISRSQTYCCTARWPILMWYPVSEFIDRTTARTPLAWRAGVIDRTTARTPLAWRAGEPPPTHTYHVLEASRDLPDSSLLHPVSDRSIRPDLVRCGAVAGDNVIPSGRIRVPWAEAKINGPAPLVALRQRHGNDCFASSSWERNGPDGAIHSPTPLRDKGHTQSGHLGNHWVLGRGTVASTRAMVLSATAVNIKVGRGVETHPRLDSTSKSARLDAQPSQCHCSA